MGESDEHKEIKARLAAAILKHYGALQKEEGGSRYSYALDREAGLINGAYRPDALLFDRMEIVDIFEVEVEGSWKALLGACLCADYAMSVESPDTRANLWCIVPDDREYGQLMEYELRLAWARPYFKNVHIGSVVKAKDCEAHIERRCAHAIDRRRLESRRDLWKS